MNILIDVRDLNDSKYVTIRGEIDVYTAPELKEQLLPISEMEKVNMIVDLRGVSYLDSTGLGVFIGIFKNVQKNHGEFKLVGLSERLERLFSITGLSEIMTIERKLEGELT
ncbi:STAS domain-containing protein [Litchfieldia salsa]|uniref:Anti-sigma factor antagonist n=1 Tax=Litchfieldia salsa TaxID=930152 RepID=A0A1H0WY07_9BACI|nr:STAS domain-containing protein [Litchfieldia salsa]SDP95480.1 anti-sigma B factor antagonist [Litchfieldia salsa]